MAIDRKSKSYKISCSKCSEERFVTYGQSWNIKVGNCSGDCLRCWDGRNLDGLKNGQGWNKGLNVSGMTGHKQSEYQKGMMRARKGEKMKSGAIEKMRLAKLGKRGELSNRWVDGRSMINHGIRRSVTYSEWRKLVFKKDNYTCQDCKKRGDRLHADHIKSFAKYPDFRLDPMNGRTLCVPCHYKRTFGRVQPENNRWSIITNKI